MTKYPLFILLILILVAIIYTNSEFFFRDTEPAKKNINISRFGNYSLVKEIGENTATITLAITKDNQKLKLTTLDTLKISVDPLEILASETLTFNNIPTLVITQRFNTGSEVFIYQNEWYQVRNNKLHLVLKYISSLDYTRICGDEMEICNVEMKTEVGQVEIDRILVDYREIANKGVGSKKEIYWSGKLVFIWDRDTEIYKVSKAESKPKPELFSQATDYFKNRLWYAEIE